MVFSGGFKPKTMCLLGFWNGHQRLCSSFRGWTLGEESPSKGIGFIGVSRVKKDAHDTVTIELFLRGGDLFCMPACPSAKTIQETRTRGYVVVLP